MARYFTQRLQAGELVMTALMDVDQDGVISTDEFLDHELVKQLLQPDVDLIGGDGVLDSWSGAFDVRAVPPGVGAPDVD